MTIHKANNRITTLADWHEFAPPKQKDIHWVDGRSAMEVARAWLKEAPERMPAEVLAVLEEHPAFGPVFSWSAEPEAKLPFDSFAGETRNSDLAVQVTDKHGSYLLAVEAKADEPFGDTVEKTLADAERRLQENPKSNGIRRLDQLLRALLGGAGDNARQLDGLRYQLLTACAGALCEAERQGYSRTVLLIHEFHTDKTNDTKHRENTEDLNRFVAKLSNGAVTSVKEGQLYGPFFVPGKPLLSARVGLYIGKVIHRLR